MKKLFLVKKIPLVVLFLAISSQSVFAGKKMYRWVDDKGNVRYSDQVPPDQAKHKREALNKNARVVDVVAKEKTNTEREIDRRLARLREQQGAIIKKQKDDDQMLLSTFQSISDMDKTLASKLLALDGQRNVLQGNLRRLEQQLQQQQSKAAQFERDGKSPPANVLAKIATSKEQIELAYTEISKQFKKKQRTRENFEADMARFTFLTRVRAAKNKNLNVQLNEKETATELGLYICDTDELCNKAWASARNFIGNYSSTSIDIETHRLITSQPPGNKKDLSLSVSKMDAGDNKQQLFLDIRCHKSTIGEELCRGAVTKRIRSIFNGYIKAGVAAE